MVRDVELEEGGFEACCVKLEDWGIWNSTCKMENQMERKRKIKWKLGLIEGLYNLPLLSKEWRNGSLE